MLALEALETLEMLALETLEMLALETLGTLEARERLHPMALLESPSPLRGLENVKRRCFLQVCVSTDSRRGHVCTRSPEVSTNAWRRFAGCRTATPARSARKVCR